MAAAILARSFRSLSLSIYSSFLNSRILWRRYFTCSGFSMVLLCSRTTLEYLIFVSFCSSETFSWCIAFSKLFLSRSSAILSSSVEAWRAAFSCSSRSWYLWTFAGDRASLRCAFVTETFALFSSTFSADRADIYARILSFCFCCRYFRSCSNKTARRFAAIYRYFRRFCLRSASVIFNLRNLRRLVSAACCSCFLVCSSVWIYLFIRYVESNSKCYWLRFDLAIHFKLNYLLLFLTCRFEIVCRFMFWTQTSQHWKYIYCFCCVLIIKLTYRNL